MATAMAFNPGDVIFSDCQPLFYYIKKRYQRTHCLTCLRKTLLTMCGGCNRVGYCNETCKDQDFKSGHAIECGRLFGWMDLLEGTPEDYDRKMFTFKLFRIMENDPGMATTPVLVNGGPARDFSSMVPQRGDESMENKRRMDAMRMVELIKDDDPENPVQVADLVKYMDIIGKYAFDILDEPDMSDIGLGLYFEPADLEHSCKPTAVCVNDKFKLSVRAIGPIPVGTKPTIDFVRMAPFYLKGRQMLKSVYDIDCNCDSCTTELRDNQSYLLRYYIDLAVTPVDPINQKQWTSMYEDHPLILQALRSIYHEYDERICLQYLITLRLGLSTKYSTKEAVDELAIEARKHTRITFGENHPSYKYFNEFLLRKYAKRFGPFEL